MKNIWKGLVLVVMISLVTILLPSFMDNTSNTVKANDAGWSEDSTGSEQDAFTIVELVPYKGLSEIGYLVGGQEPIDKELFNRYDAHGELGFLGGAISNFNSYIEKPLPSSGNPDSNWRPLKTIATQNGYFEKVSTGGKYNKTIDNVGHFARVADGSGDYRIKITGDMEDIDGKWNPTDKKNVKAYFVLGQPSGVALYNYTICEPRSVTANLNKTGDYDYVPGTTDTNGAFILNKGHGAYDVIFKIGNSTENKYYMTADYEIMEDNSGFYSFTEEYELQAGGNYRIETGTIFTYGSGQYRWVQDDTALSKPSNYYVEGTKEWVKGQKVTLLQQYMYGVELINNEFFKRKALGIPSAQAKDYPVKVITITPDDLSKPENQHIIEEADFFYINANPNHNYAYITLYETRSYEGLNPAVPKYSAIQSTINFADHDLSWDSVVRIFKRVAGIGCIKAAVIMDNTFFFNALDGSGSYNSKWVTVSYGSGNATSCNMAKLYIMLLQRNTIDFYNSFMNPDTTDYVITNQVIPTTINQTGTTGSFIRPDSKKPLLLTADEAIYWNDNTFLPYGLNSTGAMVKFTSEAQMITNGITNPNLYAPNDLTNNVLTISGSDIFSSKFSQGFAVPSDSTGEVVDHLTTVNPDGSITTPSTFTLADITSVITNNGEGFEETGGVSYPGGSDVEGVDLGSAGDPTVDPAEDGTGDSNLRTYKRVLNIQPTAYFIDSEAQIRAALSDYDVQIINMTSRQFNGSLEDINSRYDMIFMGSGAKRFNYYSTRTNFNNNLLDGLIYSDVGDTVFLSKNKKEQDYYSGNDITMQKRSELESFLAAGYPIILDTGMYQLTNLKSTTIIRTFIIQAKSNTVNFLDYTNFLSTNTLTKNIFIYKLRSALRVVRPIVQLIEPVLAEGSVVNYVYANSGTNKLDIKFALLPRGTLPSVYTYNAYLYIDENGDGIFDTAEKVNIFSNDGSSWTDMRESRNSTYTYHYDMSGLNGVYQWKIVIKRKGNDNIRGTLTGYAANSAKEDINILQIIDSSSSYNLQSKVNNSSSLIWEYASLGKLDDYNLNFDTITVQQFQGNELSKYQLVIMDNPNIAITNPSAITSLKNEIANDLGVIYTKNALGFDRQSTYYSTSKYSFSNYYTYNNINHSAIDKVKGSLQLYIYSGLGTYATLSKEAAYYTTFLTKANEGAITRYPYQIDPAILIAQNSYSSDTTIDFDLDPSKNSRLIGWYCLSDSKSPIIRKAGLAPAGSDSDLNMGLYSSSPNDVKNNYYLFSNGWCYYSGIQLAAADKQNNDNEMKLFVNTIIATRKATKRVVSSPPIINFIDPFLTTESDLSKSITITEDRIDNSNFLLTFEITGSSTNMDLQVMLDALNPSGDWNENIYKVTSGVISSTPIAINNSSKVVEKGIYVLKIPATELTGEHILKINAINSQGNTASAEVTLKYTRTPVVTFEDPSVITSGTTHYIYTDIDFNSIDADENYLDDADNLRVVFQIDKDKPITNVLVRITSGVPEADLTSVYVRAIDSLGNESPVNVNLTQTTPTGLYAMYIPMTLMKGLSSKDIKIMATNTSGNSGEATVTLLRRSLFPLD